MRRLVVIAAVASAKQVTLNVGRELQHHLAAEARDHAVTEIVLLKGDNAEYADYAGAVDKFLAAHLAWEATLEAWSGKEPELAALNERHGKPNQAVVAVLAKDPSLAGLAAQWHHFQWGPGACDVIQTVGQPQSLGATMNNFNEEMRHIISHGVTANPPLDIRHWGWAKRDKEFCGELSGRWECFFLPWNRCDAHKLTEEIAAKAKQRLAGSLDNITKQRDEETLLVSQLLLTDERGWLGKAVIRPGGGGVLQRCGRFKCDSINSARQGGQLNASAFQEDTASALHYATWNRLSWRTRRAAAALKAQFLEANPGWGSKPCAFVQIRHGDKLWDNWLNLHKTASFLVDLNGYLSEAEAILRKLAPGQPSEIFLMTEDRDMVEDANDPALSGLFKIGHAPGAVLQLSAHCRPKDRATIAIPTPRNVECTRQYGWGEGPTEFAHNMASFGLASKRPSGLQYGSRRRRGYDVNISRGGRGDAAAPTWILRGEVAVEPADIPLCRHGFRRERRFERPPRRSTRAAQVNARRGWATTTRATRRPCSRTCACGAAARAAPWPLAWGITGKSRRPPRRTPCSAARVRITATRTRRTARCTACRQRRATPRRPRSRDLRTGTRRSTNSEWLRRRGLRCCAGADKLGEE